MAYELWDGTTAEVIIQENDDRETRLLEMEIPREGGLESLFTFLSAYPACGTRYDTYAPNRATMSCQEQIQPILIGLSIS